MPISTIFTVLFYPYIAQDRTAQSAILSVRSERFALCLKERHCSQNQGSLKSEERKSDVPSSVIIKHSLRSHSYCFTPGKCNIFSQAYKKYLYTYTVYGTTQCTYSSLWFLF